MSSSKNSNKDATTDDKQSKHRNKGRSGKSSLRAENKSSNKNNNTRRFYNRSESYTNHNFYNNKKNSTEYFTESHQDEITVSQNEMKNKRGQILINHLLSFSLPERDEKQQSKFQNYKGKSKHNKNHEQSSLHLTSKEFINANYRFIVNHNGHYDIQMADPNIPIDDMFISRVVVRSGNSCPICLEEDNLMIAPRMVNCGHCFCYTCLLTYLDPQRDENEKTRSNTTVVKSKIFRECPLCAELIETTHLLPVFFDNNASEMAKYEIPRVGEDAILKLMTKPKNALFAVQTVNNVISKKMNSIPWCCGDYISDQLDNDIFPYARITKGSFKFLLKLYEEEINKIKIDSMSNDVLYSIETNGYAEFAVEKIREEIVQLKKSFNVSNTNLINYDVTRSIEDINDLSIGKLSEDNNDYFYYYQTCFNSDSKYLLSSLDIKILKSVFKEYSQFPTSLVVPIQHISFGEILTENNLSKYKYLSNYPFGTELAFIEIDWAKSYKNKDNISLPSSVYSIFKKEINERTRLNKKRELAEEYNKKKAERDLERETLKFYERENDQNYYFPSKIDKGSPNTEEQFPSFVDDTIAQEQKEINDGKFVTTVWGTKVVRNDDIYENDPDGGIDVDTASLMKQLQENKNDKNNKKKKKKFVLISSNSRGT